MKNSVISAQFHILDWFPTILDFAKYEAPLPYDIDGINQRSIFEERGNREMRTNFIYGVVNQFSMTRNGTINIFVSQPKRL